MNPPEKKNIINDQGNDIFFKLLSLGYNARQAQYIAAQAAHETGNFTSRVYKENNNLFGMKQPSLRKTTALGTKNGHAYYESISDSIKDFDLYYKAFRLDRQYSDIASYVAALKAKSYFEAPYKEYVNGVTHFYNLYFTNGTV